MSKALETVSYKSLSGIEITLDRDTVLNYCKRGNGDISDQEVAFFLRTCQAKQLDPLESGEVHLVKYDNSKPAQIVVGRDAYVRRADHDPDYRGLKSGVVVLRGDKIIKKEGTAVYGQIGETLLGGWCETFKMRGSDILRTYKEVSLSEYDKGMANWKQMPGTMIEKVAVAQCLRTAFPNKYEGLYSEDELAASGTIESDYVIDPNENGQPEDNTYITPMDPQEEPVINGQQRRSLFNMARDSFPEGTADGELRSILGEFGLQSTAGMAVSVYYHVIERIKERVRELEEGFAENEESDGLE